MFRLFVGMEYLQDERSATDMVATMLYSAAYGTGARLRLSPTHPNKVRQRCCCPTHVALVGISVQCFVRVYGTSFTLSFT
jgi:hypothetical protein